MKPSAVKNQTKVVAAAIGAFYLWVGMAEAGQEFYIGRETGKTTCTLINYPPATTGVELLDNGRVYFDKTDAERAMRALLGCKLAQASLSPDRR